MEELNQVLALLVVIVGVLGFLIGVVLVQKRSLTAEELVRVEQRVLEGIRAYILSTPTKKDDDILKALEEIRNALRGNSKEDKGGEEALG